MTVQEQQALAAIQALLAIGNEEGAAMILRGFVSAQAPAAPTTQLTGNAARCKRYRERKHSDMVPMSEYVETDTGKHVDTHVETMSNHVNSTYLVSSSSGPVQEQLAISGTTGSMLPMVSSVPSVQHMLTRSTPVEAVKGKLVQMADARERRENKRRGEAELVFRYWQAKLGHTKAMFSRDRETKLCARLAEGATPDELCYAVDGIAKSRFHMGENDSGTRYDGIETLFRNRANVEKFAGSQRGYRDSVPHPFVAEAMQAVQQLAGDTITPALGVAHG